VDFAKSLKDQSRLKNPAEPPGLAGVKGLQEFGTAMMDQGGNVTRKDWLNLMRSQLPGASQVVDVGRNVFDEPLYEAENDVRTLRSAASRWAHSSGLDVPKRMGGEYRKGKNAPSYEPIYEALLVGDWQQAKYLADQFAGKQKDKEKAMRNIRSSVQGKQPFRVGPFTSAEKYQQPFMEWAGKNLPKKDLEQVKRIQERYEKAASAAGL
jgi:hypothetical protein